MSPSDADGGSMKSGQLYECLAIVDCNTNSILEHSSSLGNCVSGTWGRSRSVERWGHFLRFT